MYKGKKSNKKWYTGLPQDTAGWNPDSHSKVAIPIKQVTQFFAAVVFPVHIKVVLQSIKSVCVCVCVLVAQSCLTLCNPTDCSPPGPSVHGILQARTLEWVAISFSKRNYRKKESEVAQSFPTLCDPMDCSLSGSSIYGIFQARVLEWVAISFSILSM